MIINDPHDLSDTLKYKRVLTYLSKNYPDFTGTYHELEALLGDPLVRRLWVYTLELNEKHFNDQSAIRSKVPLNGSVPLLPALFKQATGLPYNNWYFFSNDDLLQKLASCYKTATYSKSVLFYTLLFRKLKHDFSSMDQFLNQKNPYQYLASLKHRAVGSDKDTKYFKDLKLDSIEYKVLTPFHKLRLLKRKDINTGYINHRIVLQLLQLWIYSPNCPGSELTINNPFNLDQQVPNLKNLV